MPNIPDDELAEQMELIAALLRVARAAEKIYADWDSPHKWSHPLYMELDAALQALPKGLLDD